MPSEEVRAHVPIGPLAIVGLTAPWCGLEDGHEFGVTGKGLRRQRRDLFESVLLRSTEYTYMPSLAFVTRQDSVATSAPALSSSAQASM